MKISSVLKAGSLFGARFGAVALQSAAFFLAARYVGIEAYGQFAYSWGLALIGASFAGLGGAQMLLRALPSYDDSGLRIRSLYCVAGSILRPLCFSALIALLFVLVPTDVMEAYTKLSQLSFAATLLLSLSVAELLVVSSIARQASGPTAVIVVKDLMPWMLFVFMISLLPATELEGHTQLLLVLLLSHLISIVVGLYFCRRYLLTLIVAKRSGREQIDRDSTEFEARYGWFAISSVLASMTANLDVVIGRLMLGTESIGVYSLVKRASSLLGISQNLANMMISRQVVELRRQGKFAELQQLISGAFYMAFIPAFLLGLLLVLSRGYWFEYFSIPDSSIMFYTLLIVVLAAGYNVFCGANILVAAQFGDERLVFIVRCCSLLLLSVTILTLAKPLGVAGLAISFLAQALMLNTVVTIYLRRKHGLWTSAPLIVKEA